ncbi:hypothetical protein [Asanoa sp. NPDC050611]|uniref:hypothetical protein n=1 Tax=Asanoa sp. NPDC050611 TaxID=3157098 RepID=UPI0033C6F5DE
MKLFTMRRTGVGLALTAGSLALVTTLGSPAAATEVSPVFGGTGIGRSVERGIQKAMDDVEVSARGEGWLGECTILAVTLIEDISGTTFTAFRVSVDATCLR